MSAAGNTCPVLDGYALPAKRDTKIDKLTKISREVAKIQDTKIGTAPI